MLRHWWIVCTWLTLFLLLPGCRRPPSPVKGDQTAPPKAVAVAKQVAAPEPKSRAAAAGWRPAGFGGAGNFLSVHAAPSKAGVLYAASDVAGVYHSADNGDHWELRSSGLGNYEVSSLAVDPRDHNTIYAGVGAFRAARKAGIYRSRDGGKRWEHLRATQAHGIVFRKYRTMDAIALHPTKPGVIIAGSAHNGIWRSVDSGRSWKRVLQVPTTRAKLDMEDDQDEVGRSYRTPVSVVRFDARDPKVVLAGLYGAGVVRSTRGGVAGSFKPANKGLPARCTIKGLALGRNGVVWAAAAGQGVFRSTDGGLHWMLASGGLPLKQGKATSVAVDPKDGDVAYATLSSEDVTAVWKTTSGGKGWKPLKPVSYDRANNPTRTWAASPTLSWWVSVDPHNPRRLYFTDYWSIQRSDDGGASWADLIRGAQNTCVTDLLADTRGGRTTLYAAQMDAGLLASDDGGERWQPRVPTTWDDKVAGHYWRLAATTVKGQRTLFATASPWSGGKGKVLRSADGVTWKVVYQVRRPQGVWMEGAMVGLAVDPARPGTVYVSQDGGKVHVTRDNGDSWRPTRGQPGGNSFTYALVVAARSTLYAGTLSHGLWRSSDQGKTWARVLKAQQTIWRLAAAKDAVYATAGDANLYRSQDHGQTWKRLTRRVASDPGDEVGDQGMAIAVDPADPAHLLFSRLDTSHSADAGSGVVESRDGGKSWTPANQGLGLRNVSVLAFGAGGAVYAGTWCGGIWRRR